MSFMFAARVNRANQNFAASELWGIARREPRFDSEIDEDGKPTGRRIHRKTRHVFVRKFGKWQAIGKQ